MFPLFSHFSLFCVSHPSKECDDAFDTFRHKMGQVIQKVTVCRTGNYNVFLALIVTLNPVMFCFSR